MIVIVDYGLGNLQSIFNMVDSFGEECKISNDPNTIQKSSKLILPGVGAFDTGISNLKKLEIFDLIKEEVIKNKKPILGICLGAQIMLQKSDEGILSGLSFLDGEVKSFKSKFEREKILLPIPNMGWRYLNKIRKNDVFKINNESRFYFLHSFYFEIKNQKNKIFESNYGIDFCAGFKKENIIGVQFHPEKSHRFGFEIMKQFLNYA